MYEEKVRTPSQQRQEIIRYMLKNRAKNPTMKLHKRKQQHWCGSMNDNPNLTTWWSHCKKKRKKAVHDTLI